MPADYFSSCSGPRIARRASVSYAKHSSLNIPTLGTETFRNAEIAFRVQLLHFVSERASSSMRHRQAFSRLQSEVKLDVVRTACEVTNMTSPLGASV